MNCFSTFLPQENLDNDYPFLYSCQTQSPCYKWQTVLEENKVKSVDFRDMFKGSPTGTLFLSPT